MTGSTPNSGDFDPTLAVLPPEPKQIPDAPDPSVMVRAPQPTPAAVAGSTAVSGSVAGQGHQVAGQDINNYTLIVRQEAEVQSGGVVRRRVLDWEQIKANARSTQVPPGLEKAPAILAHERVLVLAADRGEGRTTASMYVAYGLVIEIGGNPPVERFEVDEGNSLTAVLREWGSGRLVLVDLVGASAVLRDRALNEAAAAKGTLAGAGSYLILTVPRSDENSWKYRLPDQVISLSRTSDVLPVFRRRIERQMDADLVAALCTHTWFIDQLRDAWPPSADRLGWLAATSHADGANTVAKIRDSVAAALDDWSDELRRQLGRKPDPWYRALIMAAAALEGADPGTVVAAARQLIDASGYTELDDVHPLVAPSVVSRVDGLEDVAVTATSVSFTRPEFGRAVLPHVWREHPDLRNALRNWLTRLPFQLAIDRRNLERLVDRIAALAIKCDPGLVTSVIEDWSAGDGLSETRLLLTVRLLTRTGVSQLIGRQVRSQIWNWAYNEKTDDGLRLAIAVVCGGTYGQEFPLNALTRLKHLAKSDSVYVRREVVSAVARIGNHIGPYGLLGYLADWLTQPQPRQIETLIAAVGEVLSEDHARAALGGGVERQRNGADGDLLSRFWQRVFDTLPYQQVGALVEVWLAAAAQVPVEQGDRLVEQLVSATDNNLRRIGRLVYATRPAYSLPPDPSRLDQLVALIQTRLDEIEHARLTASEEEGHGFGQLA